MNGKITLITPPDIFENENLSILFCHLSDKDQELVSKWLSNTQIEKNFNIYFYNNEPNMEWLLYTINLCDFKFINLDTRNIITGTLTGHLLAKDNFYFKTSDANLAQICQYINSNRIIKIEDFLEKVFDGQNRNKAQV